MKRAGWLFQAIIPDLDPNSAWGNDDAAAAASDFDPISDWDGGDAVTESSATAACKRKGRGKANHVAKDERKRQRRAAFLFTTQGSTEAGT